MQILREQDTILMAEIYLNCGQDELEKADEDWAHVRGLTVERRPGNPKMSWGQW